MDSKADDRSTSFAFSARAVEAMEKAAVNGDDRYLEAAKVNALLSIAAAIRSK